jgi:hypothetical protein
VAGRGDSPDENVVIELDRAVRTRVSLLAGLRVGPIADVASLGVSYRQESTSRAAGPTRTVAGSVLVDDAVDFLEFWSPHELTVGLAASPIASLSLSLDAVWAKWSDFRSIHNQSPAHPFDDVVLWRAGVEWALAAPVTLRAGYGFEPTPVPAQRGDSNYLDADRHVLAAGVGLDLAVWGLFPAVIDLHVRGQLLAEQRVSKAIGALTDADPAMTGQQVDNRGFPAFEAGGSVWQLGVTFTLVLAEGGS